MSMIEHTAGTAEIESGVETGLSIKTNQPSVVCGRLLGSHHHTNICRFHLSVLVPWCRTSHPARARLELKSFSIKVNTMRHVVGLAGGGRKEIQKSPFLRGVWRERCLLAMRKGIDIFMYRCRERGHMLA